VMANILVVDAEHRRMLTVYTKFLYDS
jgi:hypothetical protein